MQAANPLIHLASSDNRISVLKALNTEVDLEHRHLTSAVSISTHKASSRLADLRPLASTASLVSITSTNLAPALTPATILEPDPSVLRRELSSFRIPIFQTSHSAAKE